MEYIPGIFFASIELGVIDPWMLLYFTYISFFLMGGVPFLAPVRIGKKKNVFFSRFFFSDKRWRTRMRPAMEWRRTTWAFAAWTSSTASWATWGTTPRSPTVLHGR